MDVPLASIVGPRAGAQVYSYYNEDPMGSQEAANDQQGPNYRHMLVLGVRGGVSFYHLNPEHCQSDADSEVADSTGVSVYGIKSEHEHPPLWVSGSSDVLMTGHGGNALPPPASGGYPSPFAPFTPSLYRVTNSTRVTLANLWRYVAKNSAAEEGWTAVFAQDAEGHNHTTQLLDRPVLWRVL